MFSRLGGLLVALLLSVALERVSAQPLFEDLWTVSSENGVLTVYLVDELSNVTIDGKTVQLRVWNNSFTGPLLRAKRGDVVNIYLLNKLEDQSTNLHFHGFHVSPIAPGDETTFTLGNNGKIKLYQFTVPMTHPQGLFWYHSHPMPLTEWQIFNGMSGAFIIEGMLDNVPDLKTVKEKIILLRDMQFDDNGNVPDLANFLGEAETTRLVNNVVFPNLTCPAGETQMWSVANIGADVSYLLAWERANGSWASEFEVWLIAHDGVLLSTKLPITEPFLLGTANRAQFLIKCPASQSLAPRLVTRFWTNGLDNFPYTPLLQVQVEGSSSNNITNLDVLLPQHYDYRQANISTTRSIFFSEDVLPSDGGSDEGSFYINNKPFVKNRLDVRTFLGDVEKWILVNTSPEAHFFHIHQGYFQVVAVNGVPVPFYGYVDTVLMPTPIEPATNSTVEIIIPFTNPLQVGKYPFHCHIEAHADGGMMATLEVIAAPNVNVVFVAIMVPILVIILVISSSILACQWRQESRERQEKSSEQSNATEDKHPDEIGPNTAPNSNKVGTTAIVEV